MLTIEYNAYVNFSKIKKAQIALINFVTSNVAKKLSRKITQKNKTKIC